MINTTSLDLSKQLNEVGYPQNTHFKYVGGKCGSARELIFELKSSFMVDDFLIYAAPTAEEVLENLPTTITKFRNRLIIEKQTIGYQAYYAGMIGKTFQGNSTLAETVGNMYLCLRKQGFIT